MNVDLRAKFGTTHKFGSMTTAMLLAASFLPFLPEVASAQSDAESLTVRIPRIERPPTLADFVGMEPANGMGERMVKVSGFVQQEPTDGDPATQRTDVYLAYDDKNLYAVFVAFDDDPKRIRAHWSAREQILDDDIIEIMLDTFHDERRAFAFLANPFGIQADGLFTDGQGRGGGRGFDLSFDTLWDSKGTLTDRGYVVWMSIPFKSLRFPAGREQTWGIILHRTIPNRSERIFWPHVSSRIEGRMNQAGDLVGLEDISPGRNIQLTPYGSFNSSRALDTRDGDFPRFVQRDGKVDGGLDAKIILKDSLVLDIAVNPDFSQVESDQPQVTTNQRFEVFFPERRPFFLENAGFFQTPINLVFTRRIADPRFGVRLTGKAGPYAIGAMVLDDESPGKSVLPGEPAFGQRASFAIFRLNRDLPNQSTIGVIYTQRDFQNFYNRVGGADGRFKFGENWALTFQGVTSASRFEDEDTGLPVDEAGPAYNLRLRRSGRQFTYSARYEDIGTGFRTDSGFVRRRGIRRYNQFVDYEFRPEGPVLLSWGPFVSTDAVYDHDGTRLDFAQDTNMSWNLRQQTSFGVFYNYDRERIRPDDDCGTLGVNRDFTRSRRGAWFRTGYLDWLQFNTRVSKAHQINCVPPEGTVPVLADSSTVDLNLALRPIARLRVDNSYILLRLTSRSSTASIFNNHIARSRWNWQFNRELSLRVILQYNSLLANTATTDPGNTGTTSLDTRKNVNADVLLTYLLNPGTVLFIGYNSNLQNIDIIPAVDEFGNPILNSGGMQIDEIIRNRRTYINDGRGFFVKFSYLYRF